MELQPIEELRKQFRSELSELDVVDLNKVDLFRVRFLGKKGLISALLRQMGALSAEERPS